MLLALAPSLNVQAIHDRSRSITSVELTPREGGMEMEKRKGGKSKIGGASNSSNGECHLVHTLPDYHSCLPWMLLASTKDLTFR
jgi:hypothetical protein